MTTPTQGEIDHYAARPLETFQLKGITVGGLICNDMWANPGCTPMPDQGEQIVVYTIDLGSAR